MGEMADFALDTIDFAIEHIEGEPPLSKSCKYCGKGTLYWREISPQKFRLFTIDGELHSCREWKKEE